MLDVISQAKNAIEAYNTKLRIHSANIANMAVHGYKRLDISFQTVFEKTLRRGTPAFVAENMGGTNPLQLGTGMGISRVSVDFSQGEFIQGRALDLAIAGPGLFIVSPNGGETFLYTRAGQFHKDNQGYLVTETGMRVYGSRCIGGGTVGGALVPIDVKDYDETRLSWTNEGVLEYSGQGLYQIALTTFPNLSGLQQTRGTCFAETLASGPPKTSEAPGGTMGGVVAGQLEQSNVFYIGETIDSMEVQRAMSGNLTVVRMISDMISTFINRLA